MAGVGRRPIHLLRWRARFGFSRAAQSAAAKQRQANAREKLDHVTFFGRSRTYPRPAMCERYVIADQAAVERQFEVVRAWWKFSPSFNVSAQRNIPVIRMHQGDTEGVMMRWGLIPAWAEGDPAKASATHAASEGLERSRLFGAAWACGQRCILPASGFYGWQLTPNRQRRPHYVRLVNRSVFGFAGLWDRSAGEEEDSIIDGCALITVAANPLVAEVNNTFGRMPAILRSEDHERWLSASPGEAAALLRTYSEERMVTHAVSARVNSPLNDDGELILPVR